MSYRQIYYHIVFSTKNRENTLPLEIQETLFRYIWGFLKNKKCYLYRINTMEDHVHLLISLNPRIALSDLVRDLKVTSQSLVKGSS